MGTSLPLIPTSCDNLNIAASCFGSTASLPQYRIRRQEMRKGRRQEMRKGVLAVAVFVGALPGTLPAGTLQIVPTTTLQAQTSNNTSAANSFQSQPNGNLGATNVNKVNLPSCLHPANRQKVEQTFVPSPAYLRIDGRPLITNFDVELHYPSINWSAAAASASTDPVFIFQDASGFTHAMTGGSYSWVRPSTTDFGMTYLTGFYSTGLGYPAMETIGASYKGFNDTLASWGLNRIMTQRCGHTWLQTFAKINSLYNSTKQLDALQLPTWNDYEEGTEIETGIDNCMSLSASLSGNTLQWTVSGYEDTLDHYRVFISTDGQHLMPLTTMAVGSRSLNLCSYTLAHRSYVLFVQAIGRPTIRNRMSRAVAYTPHCSAGTASVNLGASPASLRVSAGKSALSLNCAAIRAIEGESSFRFALQPG